MSQIMKTILIVLLVAFARLTKTQAQPVGAVWVNKHHAEPDPIPDVRRRAKKGSKHPFIAKSPSKSFKKNALKLSKKAHVPTIMNDFPKPDTNGPVTRVPTPITFTIAPSHLPTTMDPKSSDVPSDAPSLVPSFVPSDAPSLVPSFVPSTASDVVSNDDHHHNDDEKVVGAPYNNSTFNETRDLDIDHERMLSPPVPPPTKKNIFSNRRPASNPTNHPTSSDAPATANDPSLQTETKQGDPVSSSDAGSAFNVPGATHVIIILAILITAMGTYLETKWRRSGGNQGDEGGLVTTE